VLQSWPGILSRCATKNEEAPLVVIAGKETFVISLLTESDMAANLL